MNHGLLTLVEKKRDVFHVANDKHSRDKSREVKDLLNLRTKEYKTEMKVSYRRYQEKKRKH
jgi:hypothetical protein